MTKPETKIILVILAVLAVLIGLIFAMITHFGKISLKDYANVKQADKPSLLAQRNIVQNTNTHVPMPRQTHFYTAQRHSEMPEPLNCSSCQSRKHTHY